MQVLERREELPGVNPNRGDLKLAERFEERVERLASHVLLRSHGKRNMNIKHNNLQLVKQFKRRV